ncbi:HD domain-containing protein [Halorhodospira halochloris]|uniref:HD-GYP domain-containing protein n=1 Tax=Halorhodospira halochloris TaxID=1052 RepID=UPI001EE96F0B|nr:HD domain-containing phosphohydrolase [Halorhodospira halochloris]MCG5529495.1 HD domain-containing protein [Halorhodospira halochloris]
MSQVPLYNHVRSGDLVVGKPVPYSIYDTYDRLLLRRGKVLKSEQQRKLLRVVGRTRAVSPSEQPSPTRRAAKLESIELNQHEHFDPFEQFFYCATNLQRAIKAVWLGKKDEFRERLSGMISRLGNLIDRDADAALGAAQLTKDFPNRVLHPMRKAIICDLLSRSAGMDGQQRCSVVGAALTANLGMLELQDVLDNQHGGLSDEQLNKLHEHPLLSANMLRRAGVEDVSWLRAVLEHHERMDGSGYPRGIGKGQICDEACLLMLADSFMAMVTPRSYREALTVRSALRELLGGKTVRYHSGYAKLLVKELGIYSPGTYLRLSNDEISVVARRGKDPTSSPQVYSFAVAGHEKTGQPHQRLDNPRHRNLAEEDVAIRGIYRSEDIKIPFSMNEVWGYSHVVEK